MVKVYFMLPSLLNSVPSYANAWDTLVFPGFFIVLYRHGDRSNVPSDFRFWAKRIWRKKINLQYYEMSVLQLDGTEGNATVIV